MATTKRSHATRQLRNGLRLAALPRLGAMLLGAMLLGAVLLPGSAARAQSPSTHVSAAQVAADVQRMQALVAACRAQQSACDASKVASDETVGDPAHGGFAVHWQWLRDVLQQAHSAGSGAASQHANQPAANPLNPLQRQPAPSETAPPLQLAQARLQAMAADAAQAEGSTPAAAEAQSAQAASFDHAHSVAEQVLRRPEFRPDQPTWWDLQKARWLGWLARFFDGLSEVGQRAPFLGPLLEWLFFGGAAVGLLYFILRTAQRQRRRVVLNAGQAATLAWDREATDWAQQAARAAERQDWREALHCLYWSAIVLLEVRRAWRHNPSRTPREYVRLLRPGSPEREGLGGLTQVFERVWYGHRVADEREYQQARRSYLLLAGVAAGEPGSPVGGGAA